MRLREGKALGGVEEQTTVSLMMIVEWREERQRLADEMEGCE